MAGTGTGTPVSGSPATGRLVTAPAVEPISLAEAKEHIRLDSTSFADDITSTQSIVPNEHPVATQTGTGVDVSGKSVIVNLNVGTVAATTTLDVRLQDSDDDATYADWGTAFSTISTANDNQIIEKEYTGTKQWLRAVGVTANDTANYDATIITDAATSAEDTYISDLITMAREWVEQYTRRKIITQTWLWQMDVWPHANFIELPYGSLQTVDWVRYTDSTGTENTLSDTEYGVDTTSLIGRVVLNFGEAFPSFTAATVNPIKVQFVCGYGDAATNVPELIRTAIKMLVADYYEQRESRVMAPGIQMIDTRFIERLMYPMRIFSI